ncbi:hypothetical protein LSH36_242g04005 [Paralvinella palmiformis]|uniref:Cadherin domain-containing protein n=1 Tax=Paralvinella palmiformis TaxID=53620 RepID=A0AAD9JMB7_9ANNE|nr:hypothetical protein LSH36_242g04005 [Paralvinella palmiformis]
MTYGFLCMTYGNIRTTEILDRETQSHYWLTIYAQDHGTVPMSSMVEVLVEVEDVNDNVPQTIEPVYYPGVMENSPEGTSVVKLEAYDQDESRNNRISYEITSGNPQGFFRIDRMTVCFKDAGVEEVLFIAGVFDEAVLWLSNTTQC